MEVATLSLLEKTLACSIMEAVLVETLLSIGKSLACHLFQVYTTSINLSFCVYSCACAGICTYKRRIVVDKFCSMIYDLCLFFMLLFCF